MHPRPYQNRQHQRGFTLMEILVAVAIFVTVMIVALLLYDRSNRVFKQSNEAAEMQQNTRVAFEKLVGDLRMAGFDYKRAGTPTATTPAEWVANRTYSTGTLVTPKTPNGHVYRCINAGTSHGTVEPSWTEGTGDIVLDKAPLRWQEGGAPIYEQPDEQIEYAHSAAVTIRANFDYDEPGTENGREDVLQNGNFPVVTTGNDEIVTYALVSQTGSNTDSISFYADVFVEGGDPARKSYPGGETEREVKITGVDLTNANPPYTLTRFTLDDEGEVVRTALADNIRSMSFQYWEDAQATRVLTDLNNVAVPNIGGAGPYDPDAPGALVKERLIRGKVRAVTVNIVGMNPQPDYAYTNPDETLAAAKNYRSYTLQSTIVGRNLGLEGVPQSTSTPPGPPTWDTICNGYCGITLLSWKPDVTTGGDVSYTLYYDKSSTGSFSGILPAGSQTTYVVDLTQALPDATTYYFKVGATNEYGTTLSKTFATVDVRNATKMDPPVVAVAATSKPNELKVSWTLPDTNASGTASCTAGSPMDELYKAEVHGYRVWRSLVDGFTPGGADSVKLMDETTGGAKTDGSGTYTFLDQTVAACEKYYYRVEIVEWCAAKDEYNTTSDLETGLSDPATQEAGQAIPVKEPKMPVNLKFDPTSSCGDPDPDFCYPIILNWDKVTKDVSGNDIVVLDYQITRRKKLLGVTKETEVFDISDGSNTFSESGKLEYTELLSGNKYSYEYSIVAQHGNPVDPPDCDKESAAATISFPDSCSSGATVKADSSGGDGSSDSPWTDVSALQVYEGLKAITSVEVSLDSGAYAALASPYLYPYYDLEDGEVHTVSFKIAVAGCTETIAVYVQNDAPTCLLRGTVSNNSSTSTVLDINMVSSATEIITIERIDVTWDAQTGLAWNSSTLPSNTVHNAVGSPAVARTEQITPTGSDMTIAANGTYKVRLNMAGTPIPLGFKVSNVTVRYTVPSTGAVTHVCPITLTRCSATALANFGSNFVVNVPITNASTEQLTLSSFSIAWAGQDKLRWGSIGLLSGATMNVTTATVSGTESFTAPGSDDTIDGNGTFPVVMNFYKTNGNPSIDETTVGAVWLSYTTPTSGSVTLNCRAK